MNNKKSLIQKVLLYSLLAVSVVLLSLTIVFANKYKGASSLLSSFQENSIVLNQNQHDSINTTDKEFYTLTIKDLDDEFNLYILKIDGFKLDVYTALILSGVYNQDDFISLNDKYYFGNATNTAKTDVLELMNDDDYYMTDEYGTSFVAGLQAVIIDRNYTVIKGVWWV